MTEETPLAQLLFVLGFAGEVRRRVGPDQIRARVNAARLKKGLPPLPEKPRADAR